MFFQKRVHFLGFVLDTHGISADPDHIKKIVDFPCPRTRQELQGYLGVCGFYRRFIIKYASYVEPFRCLLQTGKSWKWTEEMTRAFEALKINFTNTVVLHHYMSNRKFYVQTDASDLGISGILYQIDMEGYARIISLVSRVLTKYETRYTTTEKELLAIVYSILKFRYYLVGVKFEIITDHKSLTFLLTSPFNSARLMRWILALQEYDFNISHCKGTDNSVAHFFSRHFAEKSCGNNSNHLIWNCVRAIPEKPSISLCKINTIYWIAEITMKGNILKELQDLRTHQANDEAIKLLRDKSPKKLEFLEENNIMYVKNRILNEWKLLLPQTLVKTTTKTAHEIFGHAGSYKMFQYLNSFFFWRKMGADIKNYAKICDLCQRVKYLNFKMEGAYQFVRASKPNETISVDFYGPLSRSIGGIQYLFVIQDLFSKLVTLYPIKKANTLTCLSKLMNHYFVHVGTPERILSDHGTQFVLQRWKSKLESLGMTVLYSSIRHPQSNPVERTMRKIGRILQTYCSDQHTKWASYANFVQDCVNFTTHQSTGFSPFTLHFNKDSKEHILSMFPRLKRDVVARDVQIRLANDRLQRAFERRCTSQKKVSKVELGIGDLVLLRVPHLSNAIQKQTHKFFRIYEGPFKIVSNSGPNAFVLSLVNDENIIKGTYNRLNLRRYYKDIDCSS